MAQPMVIPTIGLYHSLCSQPTNPYVCSHVLLHQSSYKIWQINCALIFGALASCGVLLVSRIQNEFDIIPYTISYLIKNTCRLLVYWITSVSNIVDCSYCIIFAFSCLQGTLFHPCYIRLTADIGCVMKPLLPLPFWFVLITWYQQSGLTYSAY